MEAVTQLMADTSAKVVCPKCRDADLICVDLNLPSPEKTEFHIFCPSCKAETFVLKRRENTKL